MFTLALFQCNTQNYFFNGVGDFYINLGWNRVIACTTFSCNIKKKNFHLLQLKADQGYGYDGGYGGGRSNSRGKGINLFWATKLAVNTFFCSKCFK